jgi:hypothetical protein
MVSRTRPDLKAIRSQPKGWVQMKEKKSPKDDLVQRMGELACGVQYLARRDVRQYSADVEAILKVQSRDIRRIEQSLDGMLDFCFDDAMLVLYKRLCRYYYDIDPQAAASYVYAYREMWDEQRTGSGDKATLTEQ